KLQVNGQHGFDQSMAYNVKFEVPAKYLGTEINILLATLTAADAAKIDNVPVNATLTGNFSNPKISTDVKTAVTSLTNQLVQAQKQQLVNKGKDALTNIITGGKKDTTSTNTNTNETPKKDIKQQADNVLKDLFGKKKKDEPQK